MASYRLGFAFGGVELNQKLKKQKNLYTSS
ncbi:hypothetical protein SAMN05428975_2556 [Mucilaginibacter sp. OK268]|nr:hypothetical protein SAMN05428975_2556 [Mucilaginibacter sp. OK268]